jgi:glucuronate isomerase
MSYKKATSKSFLSADFLLESKAAEILYHDFANKLPIIDYHNHLSPSDIASDKSYENMTDAWLNGDHYKWRAMRTIGVSEKYITGEGSDFEKFKKWSYTVPYTLRNPLFHWTHLELQRYFGISSLLNNESAEKIYHNCNDKLRAPEFSTQGLLNQMKVKVVCTTDDPCDSLVHHQNFSVQDQDLKLLPTFRPDKAINIGGEHFIEYLEDLGSICDKNIGGYDDLMVCLKTRIDFFSSLGCKVSDHGLEKVYGRKVGPEKLDQILKKRINGDILTPDEIKDFTGRIMIDLGRLYADEGWVMQLHLGALRNNNTRLLKALGPDTGFDSIGDYTHAEDLSFLLNSLDSTDQLPKTIIYNLNPADNAVMASMIGNFNDGTVKGKIQYGSGWWFLDQKDGMEKQINALSNMGLLSCFIGMLTDSRSFLSFPRHEYFRRILCNLIGKDVTKGELPEDYEWLGSIVQDICYNNAKEYFNF